MNAVVLDGPGKASIKDVREPVVAEGEVLMKVRMVGLCGRDLNSYRGRNPMVSFPRIPGHEVAATVTPADTVAVIGCGGVGLGAVAGAAFRSATVIGVDVDDAKLATARKAGATHTINTASADLHAQLTELTDGRGPDVIIEAIGLPQTFRAAVEEVAFTGRVVYIGYAKEQVAYETRLFVQKELDILGSRNALPEDFRDVIRMLEAQRFPVDEAVTHIARMEEAPGILEAWNREPARFTKIMIEVA